MSSNIGLIAELTKKQTNRLYFSDIPIGTKFIIVEELNDIPAYDITGYFLNYKPQMLYDKPYFLGYVEKESWKIVGKVKKNIDVFLENR